MSNVNHPAHYGGQDNPYEVIKVLAEWLTPEEFVGFCKGNALKYHARANQKGGIEDYAKAGFYTVALTDFIAYRRQQGEPDGMPVAPLYWTDEDPTPVEDEHEAISAVPTGQAFLLCSSVEPHARWAVKHCADDDGLEFYPSLKAAEEAHEEIRQESLKHYGAVVEKAFGMWREGRAFDALCLLDREEIEYDHDKEMEQLTIDKQTVQLPPEGYPGSDSDKGSKSPAEQIVAALADGRAPSAMDICERNNIPVSWFGDQFKFSDRVFVRRMPAGWVEVFTEDAAAPIVEREDDGA